MSRKIFVFLAVFSLCGFTNDLSQTPPRAPEDILKTYDPAHAYFPGKRWKKAAKPELLGWSSKRLEKAREYGKTLQSAAVLVIDNGVIVAEWGYPNAPYKIFSIRKSIHSALFGIAADRGQIDISRTLADIGFNDKPPLTSAEKKATIEDLLKSRSGIYHTVNSSSRERKLKDRPKRGSHKPGAYWYYNNWSFNALLTIYEDLTGKGIFEAFIDQIGDPVGMQDFRIDSGYYTKAARSQHGYYNFMMSARDLARFGLLFMHKGRWKDKQVISESWVEKSMTPYSKTGEPGSHKNYGYMWWLGDGDYVGSGSRGQRLYVSPDQGIVFIHLVRSHRDIDVKGGDIRKLRRLIMMAKTSQIRPMRRGR